MITSDLLRTKAANRYRDVLRALIGGWDPFPLRIRVAMPPHSEPVGVLREVYETIRSQSVERLRFGYTVDWEVVETRRHARQEVPTGLWFRSGDDLFRYVDKAEEAERILGNAAQVCDRFPEARSWCVSNLSLLEKHPVTIARALLVAEYLRVHPFPGVFARQLPLPIPTKFIESEGPLLQSLLSAIAPHSLRPEGTGFAERAGMLVKESLIEFLSLDEAVQTLPFRHGMVTPAEMAAKGAFFDPFENVLVVENHITFLTLPRIPRTLALMGHGFAVGRLAAIPWLRKKANILYWGDLDAAGFAILARFREAVAGTRSVLMDRATFDAYAVPTERGAVKNRFSLSPSELAQLLHPEREMLEHILKTNHWVEQERIDCAYANGRLRAIVGLSDD